jgi:hypothetical protein
MQCGPPSRAGGGSLHQGREGRDLTSSSGYDADDFVPLEVPK